jgi:outer membrane protein W
MRLAALLLLLLPAATSASAQTFEVSPFATGGYTTAAGIDKTARGVDDLEVSGAYTWGADLSVFMSPRLGFQLMWARQSTDLMITSSGTSGRLFDMKVDQLLANVIYQLGEASARLRPFVFGGLGGSTLSAEDLEHETKLAWTVGGGVKWFPRAMIGARAHVRYRPTRLNESSSGVCDPFGFCQGSLQQLEFAGGLVLRFAGF